MWQVHQYFTRRRAGLLLSLLALGGLSACGGSSSRSDLPSVVDDPPLKPIITRDSYVALVEHAFVIYVGDSYNKPLLALAGFEIVANAQGSPVANINCETGSVETQLSVFSSNAGNFYTFVFDNCLYNGLLLNGTVGGQNSGFGERLELDGLSMQSHPSLITTVSGMGSFSYTRSRNDYIHSWETEELNLNSRTIDGDLVLNALSGSFATGTAGPFVLAWLRGSFTVISDVTNGTLLAVSTPLEFEYELDLREPSNNLIAEEQLTPEAINAWNFTKGQLELVAEDGSTLLLDADTGDPATLSIAISNGNGTDTFTAPWSLWQRHLRFDRFPTESVDWVTAEVGANPDPNAGPAITAENYNALLDHVFDVITGQEYLEPLSLLQRYLVTNVPADITVQDGVRRETYNCKDVGTATAIRVDDDLSEYDRDFRIAFVNCDINGYEFNGEITGVENRAANQVRMLDSEKLTWLDPDGEKVRFSGRSSAQSNSDDTDTQCIWETINSNIVARSNGVDAIITANNTHVDLDHKVSIGTAVSLNAQITLTSAATGGHVLSVSARNLKTPHGNEQATDGWYFTQGTLNIDSVDGSRLELGEAVQSVGNGLTTEGDTPAIAIRVTNTDGVFEFSAPWTSWQARLPAAIMRICDT